MAVLVLAALGTARGGAGSASPARVSAGFAPEKAKQGSNAVTMAEDSRSGDLVTIRVNGPGAVTVYGAAFDVAYDPSGADYIGWSKGTLLEQGGNAPNYTVALPQNGTVVVGVSRTGSTGAAASGQPIVSLTFRVRRSGAFPLAFRNAALYDSQNPPQPIAGISWLAGSLTGA